MKKGISFIFAVSFLACTVFLFTGCDQQENKITNPQNKDIKILSLGEREGEKSSIKKTINDNEIFTEDSYTLHSKVTTKDGISTEFIIQREGNNTATTYVTLPSQDAIPGVTIKQSIVLNGKDNYIHYIIEGKDIWTKVSNPIPHNHLEKGLNPKKLLIKLQGENRNKTNKKIANHSYDCYKQRKEQICFSGNNLKFFLGEDGSTTEIIAYSKKIEKDAFKVPSDRRLANKEKMIKIMMNILQKNLIKEEIIK